MRLFPHALLHCVHFFHSPCQALFVVRHAHGIVFLIKLVRIALRKACAPPQVSADSLKRN
ncbi:hypothetical protein BRCON_1871 [Candidatus Sumerlaea chitinivorans]|uniref:Uncharacterized protein n=1 Tax=Sumerlaea chitinivorans TaxID=2250252 RepID=A0A2Z4Y746_SUMC1|nr:hypothetical protein BRCON_1871 [Candidatus Sumerlaea chitinivorans]